MLPTFTWAQIKLAALKKIDPSVTSLAVSRNTRDYLNAMVPVANRGLQDLSTAGKFIVKEYTFVVPDLSEHIVYGPGSFQHLNENVTIEIDNCKSFTFESFGAGTYDLYKNGTFIETVTFTNQSKWTDNITNGDEYTVKLVFKGDAPYYVRNLVAYDIKFKDNNSVWPYREVVRMNMKEILDDFYLLSGGDIVYQTLEGTYERTSDYKWEGDSTLVIDGTKAGSYTVHYYAYPQTITDDTADTTVLSLDPEVANLLPVYMAAELVEDDDTSVAYYFRQEYEEAKMRLSGNIKLGKADFEDEWGWS